MPFVSKDGLKQLLHGHCVEIKYKRRHPTAASATCRLFCVGCYPLFQDNYFLNTLGAKNAFYNRPKGAPPYHPTPYYNPDNKNLVITYSIFDQDYRSINVQNANLIRAFPVNNKENIKKFWDYFNTKIVKMSIQERTDFKNK